MYYIKFVNEDAKRHSQITAMIILISTCGTNSRNMHYFAKSQN